MLKSRSNLRCFCACWLAVCSGFGAVQADEIEVGSIGFNGYLKVGRTTLLTAKITADNAGAYRVQVVSPDPQGNRVRFQSEPINLAAGESQSVDVAFQVGQLDATLDVTLLAADSATATASIRFQLSGDSGLLSPSVQIVGALGNPRGLNRWFNAKQILIAHKDSQDAPSGTTRTRAEAQELAKAAYAEATTSGTSFDSVVDKYSDVVYATSLTSDENDSDLATALTGIDSRQIGGPFETKRGFHVVYRDILSDEAIATQARDRLILDLSSGDVPSDPRALSAMHAIVIAGDYNLDASQVECLQQWVYYGGHLIVSVAGGVDDYLQSPLSQQVQNWIPIERDLSRLTSLPGIESFIYGQSPISMTSRVDAARIGETTGVTLAKGSDGPLIEQVAVGFGRVTMIGLDIASGPLATWSALPEVMDQIVFDKDRASRESDSIRSGTSHSGVTDLATQIHSSQASFPEIKRPSAWIPMLLILGYLLVIGPLDYLIVHRVLKKPRLTWVTFPLMVIAGCLVGTTLAKSVNGDTLRLNQTAIVDLDAGDSGACRIKSWYTVYSPDSRRAAVAATPSGTLRESVNAKQVDPSLLMWNGVPENVFGGMLRPGGGGLGQIEYDIRSDAVSGLPISTWSTASVRSDWRASATPNVESRLTTTSSGLLRGSFTHNLPFPVKNWVLAHGILIYYPRTTSAATEIGLSNDPPTIEPGRPWQPGAPGVGRRDLESYLTGLESRVENKKLGEAGSNIRQKQTAYDALELDPAYSIRMLSLHEAASGTACTGLTNTVFPKLDLSRLIRLNRAVLIGEIDIPAGTFTMDGTELEPTRTRTFVRILLPVTPGKKR